MQLGNNRLVTAIRAGSERFGALERCASCGQPALVEAKETLVAFCSECLEASDLRSYPDGWVMLGGWD